MLDFYGLKLHDEETGLFTFQPKSIFVQEFGCVHVPEASIVITIDGTSIVVLCTKSGKFTCLHDILVFVSVGELVRADNWRERFRYLNRSTHNYLRITRILKCLGEFNMEHLKAPFVRCLLYEAIIERTLDNTLNSCMNYWVMVLKGDEEREKVLSYADKLVKQANSSE